MRIFFKVYTSCGDGIARAYDAKSALLKRSFKGHNGSVNCIRVSTFLNIRNQIFVELYCSTL